MKAVLIVLMVISILGFIISLISRFMLKKAGAGGVAALFAVAFVVFAGLGSYHEVSTGHARIYKYFNEPIDHVDTEGGPYIRNPFLTSKEYDIRRREIPFKPYEDGEGNTVLTKDGVTLTIEGNLPYSINPDTLWLLESRVGVERVRKMLHTAAWSAVRDAFVEFTWREAATNKRKMVANRINEIFLEKVYSDLTNYGFTKEEAKKAFTFSAGKLRNIVLPDKLANQINEKIAAEQRKDRQQTLNEIERKKAERRKIQGKGLQDMLSQIPGSHDNPAAIINAVANRKSAEAFMKAVEEGGVDIVISQGGSNGGNSDGVSIASPQSK